MQKKNIFLAKRPENSQFNQYWFSQPTIEYLVQHIENIYVEGMKLVFLSTPSIYCSLKNQTIKSASSLFEFDEKFKVEAGFKFYDFNKPDEVDGHYDFILIDPPFITIEVWSKYASTIKKLSKPETKILCCSIKENDKMLEELIGVQSKMYKPSIPNLIYQYNFYANYEHDDFNQVNQEIGF